MPISCLSVCVSVSLSAYLSVCLLEGDGIGEDPVLSSTPLGARGDLNCTLSPVSIRGYHLYPNYGGILRVPAEREEH